MKKIDLFDFRFHEEKIEFLVPKKWQKALELQQKANKKLVEERLRLGRGDKVDNAEEKTRDSSDSDRSVENENDYSDDEGSTDSDLGYDSIRDQLKDQKFEDDRKIYFYDYKYCTSKDPDAFQQDF